jgi:predicted glycoside hydrolase/deacetylase ChbG (UPF0249 family)
MMNMPEVESDLRKALAETPHLGLGVHLVLTSGAPLLPAEQVPTLVDEKGNFLDLASFTARHLEINPQEVRAEWKTQIERFVHVTGRAPTHLDSHHHSSYFNENNFRTMLELAQEYGSAIRLPILPENPESKIGLPQYLVPTIQEFAPGLVGQFKPAHPDYFFATFYDDNATLDEFKRIVQAVPEGVAEVMCHPGYIEEGFTSSYASQRESEIGVLTAPELKGFLATCGVKLIHFGDLNRG